MQIYMIHTRQMLAEQVLCILGTPAARLRRRRRRVPRLVVTESGLAPRRGRHDGMWVHLGA